MSSGNLVKGNNRPGVFRKRLLTYGSATPGQGGPGRPEGGPPIPAWVLWHNRKDPTDVFWGVDKPGGDDVGDLTS